MGNRTSKGKWDGSQIPRLDGKVAIVTGANSGIGFEAAKKLAERGATVILACRSESRGHQAVKDIVMSLQETTATDGQKPLLSDPKVEVMHLDVGNLASVRAFVQNFRRKFNQLDLLINNAGVAMPMQKVTADGYESHFGINHLGHFLLTCELFPLLKQAPSARVVTVSSIAHRQPPKLNFATIRQGTGGGFSDYAHTKLANLVFMMELHRRLQASGNTHVLSVACHPGLCHTDIFQKYIRDHFPRVLQWIVITIFSWIMQTTTMGALPTLYAATADDVKSGNYYGPEHLGGRIGYPVQETPAPASTSEADGKELWKMSEEITETKFNM